VHGEENDDGGREFSVGIGEEGGGVLGVGRSRGGGELGVGCGKDELGRREWREEGAHAPKPPVLCGLVSCLWPLLGSCGGEWSVVTG